MKSILCIGLVLFGFIGIFAQEKTIGQAEFDTVYQNSPEKWKGKSYRMIITTQSSTEGRPQTDYSSKSIIENASTTTSRVIYENSFQSKTSNSETIRIGDKIYIREGNGVWKEGTSEVKSQPENKITNADNQADGQIEYKFLGTEKLGNQTANVYAKIARKKGINSTNNKETVSTTTTKYWFGEDGMILKSDMKMDSQTGEKIFHTRLTQVWELDPNIKIEAPNLKEVK
jgi:hypothetical protein